VTSPGSYLRRRNRRDALAEWVRTPATLPRIRNGPVIRLLAADLLALQEE
jgi:hypothetical protein